MLSIQYKSFKFLQFRVLQLCLKPTLAYRIHLDRSKRSHGTVGQEKVMHMWNSYCLLTMNSNKFLRVTVKLGGGPHGHLHFSYHIQSSRIPKTILSFDNLVDFLTELTESCYTHNYGLLQQKKIQIKVGQGKRHTSRVQKNSKHGFLVVFSQWAHLSIYSS